MAVATKIPRKPAKISFPRRGEICLVDFDPTVGAEIQKTRPALVIQNDVSNQHSPITLVAAITSKFDVPYPTEVIVEPQESGLDRRSAVLLNQIRSVDPRRMLNRIGTASPAAMRRVVRAIQISLGLVEL